MPRGTAINISMGINRLRRASGGGGGNLTVTQGSETWTIAGATAVGTYADGTPYAVVPSGTATIVSRTTAPGTEGANTINGTMKNPQRLGVQGWDQRAANYSAGANQSYPITVTAGDVLVGAISNPSALPTASDRRYGVANYSVLHIRASAPANPSQTFAPAAIGWTGRGTPAEYVVDIDANLAAITQYSSSGHSIVPHSNLSAAVSLPAPTMRFTDSTNNADFSAYEVFLPRGLGGTQTNYGRYPSQTFQAATLGILSDAYTAPQRRALYIAMLRHGIDALDPMEGEALSISPEDGGHWQYAFLPQLFAAMATGRTVTDILAADPGNTGQNFEMTSALLARLVPHDSATEPFPYRRKTISAVSGLNITIPNLTGDPFWHNFTNMRFKRESDGDTANITTTTDVSASGGQRTFAIDVQPSPALAIGDVVYVEPIRTMVAGVYDWGITGTGRFQGYNPSGGATYRELNYWATAVLAVRALNAYVPEWEAVEGYVKRAVLANEPTGEDFPTPIDVVSITGSNIDWPQDFWTSHSAEILAAASARITEILVPLDSLTGFTSTAGTARTLGTANFETFGRVELANQGVQNPALTYGSGTIANTAAPAAWDLIVVGLDVGTNRDGLGSLNNSIITGGSTYTWRFDNAAGQTGPIVSPDMEGFNWFSFNANDFRVTNYAGAQLTAAAAASKTGNVQLLRQTQTADNYVTKVGPVVLAERTKPMVALTLDDFNDGHYDILHPLLLARNIKATSYTPVGLIGASTRTTLVEAQAMKASGLWAFCLDSHRLDEPAWFSGTVSQYVTDLQAHAAELIATGLGDADDAKHLCYSYKNPSYRNTPTTLTCTANGTTTITGSNLWGNAVLPGMWVKGTGLPTPPRVVSVPTQGSAVLNQAVSTGTPSLTFCAYTEGLTATTNGTTTVTAVNTTGIVPGMAVTGWNVPAGTTVSSITTEGVSGEIVVSNAIPSGTARLTFRITDGEWSYGAANNALIAAGFKTARRGVTRGGIFTGFGLTPQAFMDTPSDTWDVGSSATIIGNITQSVRQGRDVIGLGHVIAAVNVTLITDVLDYLATEQIAGNLETVTIPQWYARVSQRSAVAP